MKFISQLWSSRAHKTNLLALFIVLVCAVFSAQHGYADELSKHTILILGDSISAAYGIRQQEGWVHLLQDDITDKATVINASVSGETSAGGLNRLPALLKTHKPTIVVIELGGNDGLRGYPIPSIRKNVQKLINTSVDAGAQVLLLGMKIPPNYGKRYTDGFERNYALLAEEYRLPLVPFLLESVAGHPALMQSDGIHPTAEAQPLIVQNVLPTLRAMLD